MSRTRGLQWQSTPGGYVGALCDGAPEDVALEALAHWAHESRTSVAGLVIEDLRGGLDAARSRCLQRLSEALDTPVVVLTDSALVRGAAACHWLGARVCAVARKDREAALDAIGVPADARPPLLAALWALKVARRITLKQRDRDASSSVA